MNWTKESILAQAERMAKLDKFGTFVGEIVNSNPNETITAEIFNVQNVLSGVNAISLDRGTIYNISSGQTPAIPSNTTYGSFKDETRNILYVATASGVWEYNLTSGVSKVYNTAGGATGGDQLPDNATRCLVKDVVNNILYVGCASSNGMIPPLGYVWSLDCNTGIGKKYDSTGGAGAGQQLQSSPVAAIHLDTTNNVLYAGTSTAGIWQYNVGTDTGKRYNTAGGAGAGSQLPSNATRSICFSGNNGILYVGTALGIWRYDAFGDVGSVINNASPVFGDALPSNDVYSVYLDDSQSILYAGTLLGLWKYTIPVSTGKLYNTTGGVSNGQQLPNNLVRGIFVDISRNIIHAATGGGGVWECNMTTDTGKVYSTAGGAINGSQLPINNVVFIFKDVTRNTVYANTVLGVWQYAYVSNLNYNGSSTRTVSYNEFCTDILTEPIWIRHIKLMCSNNNQIVKPFQLWYNTSTGKTKSNFYSSLKNRQALDNDKTIIDVWLERPMLFSQKNFFKMDILPQTTLYFVIYYQQLDATAMMENVFGKLKTDDDLNQIK